MDTQGSAEFCESFFSCSALVASVLGAGGDTEGTAETGTLTTIETFFFAVLRADKSGRDTSGGEGSESFFLSCCCGSGTFVFFCDYDSSVVFVGRKGRV